MANQNRILGYVHLRNCTTRLKRYLYALTGATVFALPAFSQTPSPSENFVRKEIIRTEGVTTDAGVVNLNADQKITTYQYVDGLGRSLQHINWQGSPQMRDIVQPFFYDANGKPVRNYLPYRVNNTTGAFRPSAFSEQSAFYGSPPAGIPNDSKAYGDISMEDSPLRRTLSVTQPGTDYQAKPATVRLKTNDANVIRRWSIVSGLPRSTTTYPAGTLSIEETVDEANTVSRTYKDPAGRIVLRQAQSGASTWLENYYVYNDYDELIFIIPPVAATNYTPDQAYADLWYFQYEYDHFGRQTGSKSPGAGWQYAIYDRWDRPVLTQTAEQRAKATPEWTFTKYDNFNRVIISGVFESTATRSALTTAVANASVRDELRTTTSAVGYTLNRTYPTTVNENNIISILYYDDYSFLTITNWSPNNSQYNYAAESGYAGTQVTAVKGLATGAKSRTLGANPVWLYSVTYYDKYYQPLQTISSHQHGGILKVVTQYAFSGAVEKTLNKYTYSGGSTNIQRRFVYDHLERPLKIYHKVNNEAEVLLSEITYNELGQPYYTRHHSRNNGASWLYQAYHDYTLQGWAKQTRYQFPNGSNIFTQELGYHNSLGTGNTARFDGIISGNRWKHGESSGEGTYNYTYDVAKRLTTATYRQKNNGSTSWTSNNLYNEAGLQYDANGNITALTRNSDVSSAAAQIDNLSYTYSGNRLTRVTDNAAAANKALGFNDGNTTGDDYTYNANGALTSDKNKGISNVTYNRLDRPERIDFSNGSNIRYTYTASGAVLTISYHSTPAGAATKTIHYVGELLFENNVLREIYHELGRAIPGSTSKYQYYLTDYLGSVRVVLQEEPVMYSMQATFEPHASQQESEEFLYYDAAPRVSSPLFDHTDHAESHQAIRLSGHPGETIGPARSISVMPGDTVRMDVYAKYLGSEKIDPGALLGVVIQAAGVQGGGAALDGTAAPATGTSSVQESFAGLLGNKSKEGNAPPAYLNYLFFDSNMNYKDGGYVQLSDAAREDGTNVPHEKLLREFIATEPGYLYVFLSNDSPEGEAYFDDFTIMVSESYIAQTIDYYPFGLVAKTFDRGNERQTKELFQGKRYEELTQWHDFHARQYDAALGRFLGIDPQGQFASPYSAMGNSPVMMIDPDGEIAFLAVVGIFAAVNVAADAIRGNIHSFKDGLISFGIGALQGVLAAAGPGGLAAYAGSGSGWITLGSAVASQINIPVYSSNNFNFSISPSLSAGSTGVRLGASVFASATIDNVTLSGGYSFGRNFNATDLSGTMAEAKWSSIASGSIGFNTPSGTYSYGITRFGGNYSQTVGSVGYSNGRFSASMENDFLSRSGDKYRTAAFRASYRVSDDVTLTGGFSIWTGAPGEQGEYTVKGKVRPYYFPEGESPSAMRNGNLFFGVSYRGNNYLAGVNSESIRAGIQNNWHNAMGWPILRTLLGGASPHFIRMNYHRRVYTSFGTYNPFTIYGQ